MDITRRALLGSVACFVGRQSRAASESARERKFELQYESALTDISPGTEHLRFWMPVAHADAFQKIELFNVEAPVQHSMESGGNGNRILHINKAPAGGDRLALKLHYRVTRQERIVRTNSTGLESA